MQRRKRSSQYDPFDLGSLSKSFRMANNQMKGRIGEDSFKLSMESQGREVRKIRTGGDFVEEYQTDMFGNRIRRRSKPIVHEIKTGDSQLSKAQDRERRRLGRRYRVHRYY
jgi:hypothetical protein